MEPYGIIKNILTTNTVAPLRERREDIPLLVDYLLKKINRDLHKNIVGVSKEMMDVFMKYGWPGNVRELENILVRAAVVAKGQVLGREDFPDLLGSAQVPKAPAALAGEEEEGTGFETLDEIEERHIRRVIAKVGRNKGEICEILGISRPTLERKLEKYGIRFD